MAHSHPNESQAGKLQEDRFRGFHLLQPVDAPAVDCQLPPQMLQAADSLSPDLTVANDVQQFGSLSDEIAQLSSEYNDNVNPVAITGVDLTQERMATDLAVLVASDDSIYSHFPAEARWLRKELDWRSEYVPADIAVPESPEAEVIQLRQRIDLLEASQTNLIYCLNGFFDRFVPTIETDQERAADSLEESRQYSRNLWNTLSAYDTKVQQCNEVFLEAANTNMDSAQERAIHACVVGRESSRLSIATHARLNCLIESIGHVMPELAGRLWQHWRWLDNARSEPISNNAHRGDGSSRNPQVLSRKRRREDDDEGETQEEQLSLNGLFTRVFRPKKKPERSEENSAVPTTDS